MAKDSKAGQAASDRKEETLRFPKQTVLFLCTHNSARSQMAEGLLRRLAADRFEAFSAGTQATEVRPEAIAVMAEKRIDIRQQISKSLDRFAGQPFDYVITLCDEANEACPIFPGARNRLHWSFPDPSAAKGDRATKLAAFRQVRDEIESRLETFIAGSAGAAS